MSYIFFGTPEFAAIILEKLIKAGLPPLALVCNPDRPLGRKKIISPPQTKIIASRYPLITVLQPEKLDSDFLNKLRDLNADFFIVAAYAKILREDLLKIPRLGVIGVHPSLLPKYRGASPIQTALLNRDKETGVALFMIDEKVDHGPVLQIKKLNIKDQNYSQLEKELGELAVEMLIGTLPEFLEGKVKPVSQDETKATLTEKFETKDGYIDYESIKKSEAGDLALAKSINAKIRALFKEPGVYTIKDGKRIKILKSEIKDNRLHLSEIQMEGKKPTKINGNL